MYINRNVNLTSQYSNGTDNSLLGSASLHYFSKLLSAPDWGVSSLRNHRAGMDIATVLSSGVVAGLIAGLVSLRTSERQIAIENITKQREIWRDKVRTKSLDVTNAIENKALSKLCGLYTEFSHLLNPEDTEDLAILSLLWCFKSGDFEEKSHVEFIERVSLLLKHDWERAKREAKPWFFFTKEPERTKYDNFEHKRQTANKQSQADA